MEFKSFNNVIYIIHLIFMDPIEDHLSNNKIVLAGKFESIGFGIISKFLIISTIDVFS